MTLSLAAVLAALAAAPARHSGVAAGPRGVPAVDPNALAAGLRAPTPEQLAAAERLRASHGGRASVRWNALAGSPAVVKDFLTEPFAGTPEEAARAFVAANAALFGVGPSALVLAEQREALGGYLLRFQQRVGEVDVLGGGLGLVLTKDGRVRMVLGSTFRDAEGAQTSPAISASAAASSARASLEPYAVPPTAIATLPPSSALDELERQLAPALAHGPSLNVFPVADGYRLAWNVLTFSRNPFGVFSTQVDATDGSVLARENLVRRFQGELPYTADIFPKHPTLANPDTGELKLDERGEPEGMRRVNLRGFNPGTNATGVDGTLAGPRALVRNMLAVKQPFAQAAGGTWHFRQNNPPFESQPNEADDLAEPAGHIDEVGVFFFINYLMEYLDDLHRRGDAAHNPEGEGDFPDAYPNSDRPLVGLAHFPNELGVISDDGPLRRLVDTASPDALARSLLGLDDAIAVPVTVVASTSEGSRKITVNPTAYGHGYLFNDLAKESGVVYHESMHSISTPIAGFEGLPEGRAIDESQADLWAYALTGDDAVGRYVIRGARFRQRLRAAGQNPEAYTQIRSARSSLKYSQLGTRAGQFFHHHRDGEIFSATMFDLRELLIASEPEKTSARPSLLDGQLAPISKGQDAWERLFLGMLYILSTGAPDTFTGARDALIEADRMLYPSDSNDPASPGRHEALIWQVFASHEMGVNAAAPNGGRQIISTRVTPFAAAQESTAAPGGVTVAPASANSLRVSWKPVQGAFAYEVFKRKAGTAGKRQFAGVPAHPYFDGDDSTTGWSHVAYAVAPATSYEDRGAVQETFAPAGLSAVSDASGFNELLGTEYAVRALSVNAGGQVGVSDLSAGASVNVKLKDITSAVSTSVSNMVTSGGVTEFDQTLTNNGVGSPDGTAYAPVSFQIVATSDPSVTVLNADNGGDGRSAAAVFRYDQTLPAGATSAPRRLRFNNPHGLPFTFDAVITARVRTGASPANGSQPGDGQQSLTAVTETYRGTIVAGDIGLQLADGLTYVDVPFKVCASARRVRGVLAVTSPSGGTPTLGQIASPGTMPDLDFELRDSAGNVLAVSNNVGSGEEVNAFLTPGETYIYRVVGFLSGPADFQITSTQFVEGSGGCADGTAGATFLPAAQGLIAVTPLRLTINPATRLASAQALN
ncbi:MAG TPA: M36 family metallopeptidase [Pyrinomonadaceae bacterium]|nr:M36 family metallopeptidase [Pyrinomonadaceae bacterium]